MRIKLTWIEGVRKTPVPKVYACTMSFDSELTQLFSVTLTFTQATRIRAELEFLAVKDIEIPADTVFYITEGGKIVATGELL